MNLDQLQAGRIRSGDLDIAWYEAGHSDGFPILLIHGFASTAHVNWVFPGWVKTLGAAGYRVLAFDNRGHGQSDKPHDPAAYTPEKMAGDALSSGSPQNNPVVPAADQIIALYKEAW